MPKTPEDGWS